MRIEPVVSAILSMVLLTASGCGSGGGEYPAAASVGVRVEPPNALVAPSGTVAFRATITGTAATSVTWSVDCGSITQGGIYTAPSSTGTCRVTATSAVAAVSSTALVSVGSASGWAATCAAEPEPTTNVVYACDCQSGAQAGCLYEANAGLRDGSKAHPWKTWAEVQAAFRALPAGGTVALCKGGAFLADSDGLLAWNNASCSATTPCTLRDYAPSWGGVAKPAVSQTASNSNVVQLYGNLTDVGPNGRGGYRFLNIRFYRPDGGATTTATSSVAFRGIDYIHDVEVCNCEIDGFGMGFYVAGAQTGSTCSAANWKIRGNRVVNNCTQNLFSVSGTDVDGNVFDNNGHGLCGSYPMGVAGSPTTHTIYLDGGPAGVGCRVENVTFRNNEFYRNAPFHDPANPSDTNLYPQGSCAGVGARNALNVTYENNLFDWTPCHPSMDGSSMVGGNVERPDAPGIVGITLRRNRIRHCRGAAIAIDSIPSGLIEDNLIVASGPGQYIHVPQGKGVNASSVVVRNNTIYSTGADTGTYGIWATDQVSTTGNIVTGNSVTFAGPPGAACYRVSDTSKVAFMDNNQCSGATSYATTDGFTTYTLASWSTATGFDAHSIMPQVAGLFVNAPADLTPAVGSPLVGAASTAQTCTVLSAPNQPCSSPVAVGTSTWNALDTGTVRSGVPNIGAIDK